MNIEFLEIAEKELDEAKEYYDTQHSGLGDQFIIEIISVLERIKQHPNAWHPLGKRTRRCQVKRFPYAVIYQTGGCPRIETVARESHFESDFSFI